VNRIVLRFDSAGRAACIASRIATGVEIIQIEISFAGYTLISMIAYGLGCPTCPLPQGILDCLIANGRHS